MKIFLTGFMGCGKTTLAKKLSARLGYELVDLDHEIEKQAGKSVGEYFALHGESAFRELESQTLKTFPYQQNSIIATGGGTPCYFDNIDWMNLNGLTVYIEMSPTALAKRLENGKAKRPLLKDLDEQGIVDFITQKLEERNPFYRKASLVVNGISLTAESLESLIPSL
jgi:shikimate kinase